MKIIQKKKSEIKFRNDLYRIGTNMHIMFEEVGKPIGYVSAFNVFIKKNSLFIYIYSVVTIINFIIF